MLSSSQLRVPWRPTRMELCVLVTMLSLCTAQSHIYRSGTVYRTNSTQTFSKALLVPIFYIYCYLTRFTTIEVANFTMAAIKCPILQRTFTEMAESLSDCCPATFRLCNGPCVIGNWMLEPFHLFIYFPYCFSSLFDHSSLHFFHRQVCVWGW